MHFPKFQIEQVRQGASTVCSQKPSISPVPVEPQDEGIELHPESVDILPSSFVIGIFGGPGSGKSTIIAHMLKTRQLLANKFERVIFIGPTIYKGIVQDKFNTNPKLDLDWIMDKLKQCIQWECQNALIIFDDIISSLAKNYNQRLIDLFFNRRHLLKRGKQGKGTISIIVTGQKYNMLPVFIRTTINSMIMFPLTKQQLSVVYSETNISLPKKVLMQVFGEMSRHQFLFFNFQNNKAFNNEWVSL